MILQGFDVVTLTAIVFLAGLVYRLILFPLFFYPLAKVPNAHWSSPLSPLWILATRYKRRELHTVKLAHERFGPIVQLGPKDISISCFEDGIRTVYHKGFDKPAWYDFFNYFGYVQLLILCQGRLLIVGEPGQRMPSVAGQGKVIAYIDGALPQYMRSLRYSSLLSSQPSPIQFFSISFFQGWTMTPGCPSLPSYLSSATQCVSILSMGIFLGCAMDLVS